MDVGFERAVRSFEIGYPEVGFKRRNRWVSCRSGLRKGEEISYFQVGFEIVKIDR